eukprot:IDg8001t1
MDMASPAFVTGACVSARSASHAISGHVPRSNTCTRRARSRGASMQLPPSSQRELEAELTEEQRGPKGYVWDKDFPGTLKPGTCKDNWPLEDVLA